MLLFFWGGGIQVIYIRCGYVGLILTFTSILSVAVFKWRTLVQLVSVLCSPPLLYACRLTAYDLLVC